ncbi:LVIVD repeat-containing protein [Flexithrix dorotheae]|uniref:LVIVD repeat-containing protein n=1 Tax=Flexithrix dorotheae TaxID=70993 RepID=UPI0003813266|nr:hypothetical protein [Flexithrix dorotheae]
MKIFPKIIKLWPAFFFLVLMGLQGCEDKCESVYTYMTYEPVYMSFAELRSAITETTPQTIETPGKIYLYDNYLLINEVNKGIHVIDNENPASPQKLKFIEIPGNVDMAVKNGFLYADSYVDLVVLDISDINSVKEVNRVEDVFPIHVNWERHFTFDQSQGVVTDWIENEVTETRDCGSNQVSVWREGVFFDLSNAQRGNSTNFTPPSSPTSIGGSMARFTVVDNYLYTVDESSLNPFDISSPSDPVKGDQIWTGFGIETIFPYKDHLFLGGQTGMQIFSLKNAAAPEFVSNYAHINSCDPVVVNDDYAYVTLRSGNPCVEVVNQLDVLDISEIENPKLLKSFSMQNPHGLGIDGNNLFICEGEFGLKHFDAADPLKVGENMISHFDDMHAFDVIPYDNRLMMIGNDGLYQYDYSGNELKLLSTLTIVPKP